VTRFADDKVNLLVLVQSSFDLTINTINLGKHMKLRHLPVLLGLMLLVGPAFAQTIVHDESINGELSDSGAMPTPVTLVLGLNTIEGSLGGLGAGGGGGASNGNDADIFTQIRTLVLSDTQIQALSVLFPTTPPLLLRFRQAACLVTTQ